MELWKELEHQARQIRLLMLENSSVFSKRKQPDYCISSNNILLDFNHQWINTTILKLLIKLAESCHLPWMINSLMEGNPVNTSENKPALHTATRASAEKCLVVNNQDIIAQVLKEREHMYTVAEQIRKGEWFGYSNKKITDVVNIGVGGSYLGAQFCIGALTDLVTEELQFHFIADVDPNAFKRVVSKLQPETTLFIISSKSFTTQETMANARKAMTWIGQSKEAQRHFIAITAFPTKARELGYQHILTIGDWVGGRFSFCSAINLITCIAIGKEHFSSMLKGAESMDEHFSTTPFSKNLPVILALLGIWNNNFLHIHLLLVLTYAHSFQYFVSYIQQLDMESNGKSIDKEGRAVNYATGPVILGGNATQVQHSYYQLLCQGTHKFAADLLSLDDLSTDPSNQVCLAHREIFTNGFNDENNPLTRIPVNIPINHIRLSDGSPTSIGSIIALYEHKIFVQSVIWNINPFDQPGVDGVKKIFKNPSLIPSL